MSPVIDLTSSPEPDESPNQAAKNALRKFQSKEQVKGDAKNQKSTPSNDVNEPGDIAASAALRAFEPREQKDRRSNNGSAAAGLSNQRSRWVGHARYELQTQKRPGKKDNQNGRHLEVAKSNARQQSRDAFGSPPGAIHKGSLASLLLQRAHSVQGSSNASLKKKRGTPRDQRFESRPPANHEARTERVEHFARFHATEARRKMEDPKRRQRSSLPSDVQAGANKLAITPIQIVDSESDENDEPRGPYAEENATRLLDLFAGPRPSKRQRISEPDKDLPLSLDGAQKAVRRPNGPSENSAARRISSTNGHIPIRSTPPTVGLLNPPNRRQAPSKVHVVLPNASAPAFGTFKPLLPLPDGNAKSTARRGSSLSTSQESVDLTTLQTRPDLVGSAAIRKDELAGDRTDTTSTDHPASEVGAGLGLPLTQENLSPVLGRRPAASTPKPTPNANVEPNTTPSTHGSPYTPEEDALLIKLKEVDKLRWEEIVPHFPGRSYGSVQVRYSSKLKGRSTQVGAQQRKPVVKRLGLATSGDDVTRSTSPDNLALTRPKRRRRNNEASVTAGFISWQDVKSRRMFDDSAAVTHADDSADEPAPQTQLHHARSNPKSLSRILRQREIGSNCGRSWMPTTRSVPDEVKEHVFDDVGPHKFFKGTSGDVTCLAWSPDGRQFAAGSIAITDERSMQYNRPCNLLIGDYERGMLHELPEHHTSRPAVDPDSGNVNGLDSMRETQDSRLFMTVANVQFSSDSSMLFSAGSDKKVRAYEVDQDIDEVSCQYEIEHAASLDLLSVNNAGVLATACHQSADGSIGVYRGQTHMLSLSPSRVEEQTKRAIFPSALRWGLSAQHSSLLLAGFSIDSVDEERAIAGETCLWDIRAEARIRIGVVTRNVFDVAWNPAPSSTSTHFAVASTRGTNKKNKGTRSVVQCFAPGQDRAARVLEWECPAFDINDLVYCRHDDNLLAAGATDGKVYVWDKRFADRSNTPLHVLEHGDSLNVLDHDRERETADTGVRFLSWGATSSRLYSGSSDGVVKMWDPYRSTGNARVKDVVTFTSAVMSGAFSPDYCDLLIGEDQGRINSLSIGHHERTVRSMQPFQLHSAPAPVEKEDRLESARKLLKSGEVEFRPMGSLPILQAVQGPKYRGPYLAPSNAGINNAELAYQHALDDQNEVHGHAAMSLSQSTETEQALREVDKHIREAQDTLMRLQSRTDDAAVLGPQAEANQRALCCAEKNRLDFEASLSHPTEHCKLDCNYLPASIDDGAEVPVSHRSQARIPSALRPSPPLDIALLTPEDLAEAGLTAKCRTCFGPAKAGKRPLCDRCYRAANQLTASCEICAAPVRAPDDGAASNLCERCDFACFRCARPITLGRNASSVTCDGCGLTWKAGVLGYELVRRETGANKKSSARKYDSGACEDQEYLGDGEMEHHASRWQTGM